MEKLNLSDQDVSNIKGLDNILLSLKEINL